MLKAGDRIILDRGDSVPTWAAGKTFEVAEVRGGDYRLVWLPQPGDPKELHKWMAVTEYWIKSGTETQS